MSDRLRIVLEDSFIDPGWDDIQQRGEYCDHCSPLSRGVGGDYYSMQGTGSLQSILYG